MKLKEPALPALQIVTLEYFSWIMPPEVVKQHGDVKDWRNLVGTGPFMLTDWVEASSSTRIRNPDYWGHDEKYPENRLPYVDEVRYLVIPEEASLQAALLSGKIDYRGPGGARLDSVDTVVSMQKTNPEIALHPHYFRSNNAFAANVRLPPFDDLRVRKAMQMALDLETIAATTFEEQQMRAREVDLYAIGNHWQIWGPITPTWWAVQPWVMGYNGEFGLGPNEDSLISSRVWIDSQLKKEMGF